METKSDTLSRTLPLRSSHLAMASEGSLTTRSFHIPSPAPTPSRKEIKYALP